MDTIKGKNVLITGATGGIGSKTAKLLSASGANLFIAARNKEKLQSLAKK
jgi:short-subunit dehydrogenase